MNWAVLFLTLSVSSVLTQDTSDTPTQLFEDYWQWILKTFPESATKIGVHEYDDKLNSHSEADRLQHLEAYTGFLNRTEHLLNVEQNENDTLNLEVLKRELGLLKEFVNLKGYLFAVNNLDSSQVSFERTIQKQQLETEEDYWKYLQRLKSLSKQIEEDIELMKTAMKQNLTYHNSSVFDIPRQISRLEVDPEETIYFKAFREENMPSTINSTSKKEELRSSAIEVIKESIQPAYKKLREFMENEYSEALRPNIGLSCVPNGKELYSFMIRRYTSTNMTAEEIHEIGLKEVQRISKEMQKIINDLGFNESIREFSNRIRNDEKFRFTSKEEMLQYSRDLMFNKIYPVLPKAFKRGPKMNLTGFRIRICGSSYLHNIQMRKWMGYFSFRICVEAVPESMAKGPLAMYFSGSVKDNRPGTFVLNVYEYASTSKTEFPTLSLHEGSPGHHFQIAYYLEKEDAPGFRKNLFDGQPYMYSGYLEGWALYAEYLGKELGIYEDPYDLYGHYAYDNLRACRLVVDTGIHYLNWTKEEAIDYFLEHTVSSRQNIVNEINRYITWPGQALGYKICDLKIRELRESAEKQLGSKFDIRDFHEVVLDCGPVSMEILAVCVNNYIKQKSG